MRVGYGLAGTDSTSQSPVRHCERVKATVRVVVVMNSVLSAAWYLPEQVAQGTQIVRQLNGIREHIRDVAVRHSLSPTVHHCTCI